MLLAMLAMLLFVRPTAAQDPAQGAIEHDVRQIQWGWESDAEIQTHHRQDRVIFALDQDAVLGAGERAEAVVAIGGSAIAAGDVEKAVVALFGDAHTSGRVGEAVVAVFGDATIGGDVRHDVVAIGGDVALGRDAVVNGDVIAVGGRVVRDPTAAVRGDIHELLVPGGEQIASGLGTWFRHCAAMGRPLALAPGLEWAWGFAIGCLALYVTLAILLSRSVDACVRTFERYPGQTVLTAIIAVLLTPLVIIMLAITVIGMPLIPLLWLALLVGTLFGKVAVLAALGRRLTARVGGVLNHAAVAVLIGGVIVLLLYLVPVLGFVVFNVLWMLGIGVVLYTLLLTFKAKRQTVPVATTRVDPPPTAPTQPASDGTPASSAELARADFWIRMAALLVDVVLVGVVMNTIDQDLEATLIALAVYGAVMWKLRGTTIGGIVCNLQVVRVDGRELDWTTCIVRALSCFLSLAIAGLGFLWIAFSDERQAWHDKIAGTVVVRVPKGISLL
jgi:uncharacterized RDD family membrane protein YckC